MHVRAVLIDDERLARKELRRLLAAHEGVELIGEAASVAEAKALIEREEPELIFLDVEMPDGTGFDLLGQLDDLPQVIFTTAFDAHALKAFEVNALDYLLKPVEPKRLAAALQKVTAPVKGATLIGDGPTVLHRVTGIGNDFALDEGVGMCGKGGQSVPAGVGQPTVLMSGLTVGGTAA